MMMDSFFLPALKEITRLIIQIILRKFFNLYLTKILLDFSVLNHHRMYHQTSLTLPSVYGGHMKLINRMRFVLLMSKPIGFVSCNKRNKEVNFTNYI